MKTLVQIGSRVLAAYFILLPFLFGYHAHSHPNEEGCPDKQEVRVEASDCSLCELYYAQVAFWEPPFLYTEQNFFLPDPLIFAKAWGCISARPPKLRDPPSTV